MANPTWFDADWYADRKVEQLNAIRWNGKSDWNVQSYQSALQTWRNEQGEGVPGATINEKAYNNFLACNTSGYMPDITRRDINASPNELFNVDVYLTNLAAYANKNGMPDVETPPAGWTSQSALAHLVNNLHTSAWAHYTTFGMSAGINPSNEFDTNAYLAQRAAAMNSYENLNGSLGWQGRRDWTSIDVRDLLQGAGKNPIEDFYEFGQPVLDLEAQAPVVKVPESADNPWVAPVPPDPYEQNVTTVTMTAGQTGYQGVAGVNTEFNAEWTNQNNSSTIAITDNIVGGANAYNTLAIELNASWPGFTAANSVRNIGRIELTRGAAAPSAAYFDGRNITGAERYDIHDGATGVINLKNLTASVGQINIYDLQPQGDAAEGQTGRATQATSIEYAAGAVSGGNDSLSLGVSNVATEVAAAPIILSGIENLAVNAIEGDNFINLQGVSGVKNLAVTGNANLKVTNVANNIASYDMSASTGDVNMAASNLQASTVVKGGFGMDTLTLTQNFTGTPTRWTNLDALAINAGVSANINLANVTGLQSLWMHSNFATTLNNVQNAGRFFVFQANTGADTIAVNGNIRELVFSNAGSALNQGAVANPTLNSNVAQSVIINAKGEGTLAGQMTFAQVTGDVTLSVEEGATFGNGKIIAKNAKSFTAEINGDLANGAVFNVVDAGVGGAVTINAANGIIANDQNQGQLTLDADGASTVNINAGGAFALASGSSIASANDINIALDGDSDFNAAKLNIPMARNIDIQNGGAITLGNLGSANAQSNMQLTVDNSASLTVGSVQTGVGANFIANVAVTDTAQFGNITTTPSGVQGDVQMIIGAADLSGSPTIKAADIFLNFSEVTGNGFTNLVLNATESIIFTGAAGDDNVKIQQVGMRGPSSINLGDGADKLVIASNAVATGQNVIVNVDMGQDSAIDTLTINSQKGAQLSVYVNHFEQGNDVLYGFSAQKMTTAQASALLAQFGVANINVTDNMLTNFGESAAKGTGVIYGDTTYAFNGTGANATNMVAIIGATGNVDINGTPAPVEPDAPEDAA